MLLCVQNILKLTVTRLIIINVILCIASVIPNQYKQKSKMLIDFDYLVSQLYIQHCTFVEIGEGVCSLFIELTLDTSSSCKKPTTQQMFFGNCLCSEFRGWQLCSHQLALQRPEDCVFEEGVDCPSSSARVHRRLCDITGMSQWNTQCNCSVPLAGMQQEPLCGFRTCFANPMPASICTPRTVCGTARCDISLHGSLYAIKCDRRCKDHQSFCEQTGPATSEKRMVTSEWTEWQSLCSEDKASIQQFEAECLDTEGNPAFDCIGPGLLCCGLEEVDCICEVKQEDNHLRVFRYTITLLGSKESEHLSLRVRSVGLKGQAKVWHRLMDLASKEDETDSLFSNPRLKGKKIKEKCQLEPLNIGKFEPKGNQKNVHPSSIIVYENISQLLQNTTPPYTQLTANALRNNLKHSVHTNFNQQSEFVTLASVTEKQETKYNLTNSSSNLSHHSGGLKNAKFRNETEEIINFTSDASKSYVLEQGTNIGSSIDNTETHEQYKDEISQYHFTVNPNAEPKKLTTTTESTVTDNNKKSVHDDLENKNADQNHIIVNVNSKNNDNEQENTFLNEANKDTIGNTKSIKQTLNGGSIQEHNLSPETNEEKNDLIDKGTDSQTDTNKLQDDDAKYPKSIHKDSLTDNELPMEQNFFQTELDYNRKNPDSNKNLIKNETLSNNTLHVNTSTSSTKQNLKSNKHFQNFTEKNINDEQKSTSSVSESGNVNQYAATVETNLTSPFFASDEKSSIQKVSGDSKSIEAKNSKKKGKYENVLSEECISISETNISLTNQTNLQTDNNLNKSLKSNSINNYQTKENKTKNIANNTLDTKILTEESKVSTVSNGDSTTACITIKLENQSKPDVNSFDSTVNNTTDISAITKFNSISQPNPLNITNRHLLTAQIKPTKPPQDNTKHGKLTKSREHILMDQKEALKTVSNLNPTMDLEEDKSKSQNSLYDEPEPVLKDLDKDDVDDNMADVLNNMIGMKRYDKLTWTEKKDEDSKSSPEEKKVNKDTKHSLTSPVFSSNKEDLETNALTVKTKKTKKKLH